MTAQRSSDLITSADRPIAQKTSAKKLAAAILHSIVAILIATQAHAQSGTSAGFFLNGLASYEKLRKEYYIGALFLQTLDADSINFAGKKRMEMRVSIAKWTPRRFSRDWAQAIFLNNGQESLTQFVAQIQAFTNLPKDYLTAGDRITVDMDPDHGTTVYLNGNKAFNVTDNAFFYVLLNVWVGKRPPSSDFRNHILIFPAGQAGQDLLVRFQDTVATDARRKEIAGWFKSKRAPVAKAKAKKIERVTEAAVVVTEKKPPVAATVTATPRAAGISSTSRKLGVARKYSHTE